MRRDFFKKLFYLILLLVLIQGIGCQTTKSMYRKVKPQKAGLRKRVLLIPVIDQAKVGEARAAEIMDKLVHLLEKDRGLLVRKGMKPMPSIQKTRSFEFGIVIDPDLAKRAEEMGMNVLITGVLNPFEVTFQKKGFWPLSRIKRELEISLLVNAIDVINGTLFISNLETEKIEISEDILEWEEAKKGIDDNKLANVLSRIIERQASAISRGLREQPWYGRVISANQKTIIVNAGKDIGLTQGIVFDVFGRGESILSASGKSLYLLGPKVGEIKTVSVMESYASAVPLNGGQFRAGQVIRTKD